MKVAVQCTSPLLQKSLEIFLEKHLTTLLHAEIILCDERSLENPKCFYIASEEGADLKKPFSKSQLILALEKRYAILHPPEEQKSQEIKDSKETLDFSILEKRIESLTQEYQSNIIRAVKAFYEK